MMGGLTDSFLKRVHINRSVSTWYLHAYLHCESSTRKVADFCLKTRPVRVPLVKKFSLILAKTALRDLPSQKVSFVLPLRVSRKPLVDCSTAF